MAKRELACACKICSEQHRIEQIKRRGNLNQMRKLIDKLNERLADTENELDVDRAIFDGSWPSARQEAHKILRACENRQAAATGQT